MKPEITKRLETKENRILATPSGTGSKNRNPLNKQLLSLNTNYSSSLSFEGEWNNYNNSNKLNPQEPNYLSNFNIKKERDGTIYFKSSGILVVYNGFNEAEIHFTPLNYMGVLGYPDHLLNSTQNIDLRLILAMGYRGLVNLQYAIDNKLFPNIALLKGATNKTMANFAFRMGFGLRIPHTYSTYDLEYLIKNNIVLNYQPNLNNNPYNPYNPDNPENNTKCDYVYIKGNFAREVLLGRCCLVKSPGNSNLKLNQLVALKDIEDYLRENKEDKDFNYINIAPENDNIFHILAQTDDIRDFIEGLKKREFKDIKVVKSLLERVIK